MIRIKETDGTTTETSRYTYAEAVALREAGESIEVGGREDAAAETDEYDHDSGEPYVAHAPRRMISAAGVASIDEVPA
jgi:hypothetical protein